MIKFEGSDIVSTAATYSAQVITLKVLLTDCSSGTGSTASTTSSWLTCSKMSIETSTDYTNETYLITLSANSTTSPRSGIITFKATDDNGVEWTSTFTIMQGGNSTAIIPVWKDYYFTTDISPVEYSIELDGSEIYSGRAYMRPNATGCSVNISKIVQDYLETSLPNDFYDISETEKVIETEDSVKDFKLKINGNDFMTYHYINDWSYKYVSYIGSNNISMSNPVNGHANSSMIIPFSEYCNTDSMTYYMDDVSETISCESGSVSHLLFREFEADSIMMDNHTYSMRYCGDYALYYKNRKGGYDAFLIEGMSKKSDSYEKYSFNRSFDNNTIEFEEGTYHSQISTSYELHTGWLTDSESEILAYNLIPSNEVYLHNLQDNSIVPVVMSMDSTDYKTFKNQGRGLVKYTLKCKESQYRQLL